MDDNKWVNLKDALEWYTLDGETDSTDKAWIISIRRYLKQEAVELPSLKVGEWRDDDTCSICAYHCLSKTRRYCASCGAKMKNPS